jgi:hypothetical protein
VKKLLALLTLVASVAVAGVAASPASAVKFGEPDTANAYPWVGLMVAVDVDGDPLWRCTGSLIERDLFLTAGHCVSDPSAEGGDPVDSIRIWFTQGGEIIATDPQYLANLAAGAEDLCAGVKSYPCGGYSAVGEPEALSGWTGQLTIPQTYDLGLVHITEWVIGTHQPTTYGQVAPGRLPGHARCQCAARTGKHRVHGGRVRVAVGQAGRVGDQAADGGHRQLRQPPQRAFRRLEPAVLEQPRPGARRLRRHLLR